MTSIKQLLDIAKRLKQRPSPIINLDMVIFILKATEFSNMDMVRQCQLPEGQRALINPTQA